MPHTEMHRNRTQRNSPAKSEREKIADRVRAQRAILRMSQDEVASVAGVGTNQVQAIEGGRVNVRFATLSRVANALGLSISLTEAGSEAA